MRMEKVSLKLDLPTNSSLHLKEQQQSKNSCSSFHAATQVNCAAVLKDKTTYTYTAGIWFVSY